MEIFCNHNISDISIEWLPALLWMIPTKCVGQRVLKFYGTDDVGFIVSKDDVVHSWLNIVPVFKVHKHLQRTQFCILSDNLHLRFGKDATDKVTCWLETETKQTASSERASFVVTFFLFFLFSFILIKN